MINCIHWNCNSLKSKLFELEIFMKKFDVSIASINETKLNPNQTLKLNSYEIISKSRNSRGGGVAIIIRNNINYEINNIFDNLNLEIIALDIFINSNKKITFISWYLPPNSDFPDAEFFNKLNQLKSFILCGDLNSKSKLWFSKDTNKNGKLLEEEILKNNFTVIHNRKPTFYSLNANKYEVLDIILTSANINDKVKNLNVISNELSSDHFVMKFDLKIDNHAKRRDNTMIRKTDWNKFNITAEHLFSVETEEDHDLSLLNIKFQEILDSSLKEATTVKIKKVNNINLPNYIMDLIRSKSTERKLYNKTKSQERKTKYNLLSKIVKDEIRAYKKYLFDKKCCNLLNSKLGESRFWKNLKEFEENNLQVVNIPYLINENQAKIFNDKEKCDLFANKLEKTFQPYDEVIFNSNYKEKVERFVKSNDLFVYGNENNTDFNYENEFNIDELNNELKNLKKYASPGNDNVSNRVLINLGEHGKLHLLRIINYSFSNNSILDDWKIAKVKMIPKKPNDPHNINNYRPISLTSSIIKIIERMIKKRLVKYLDDKKLIIQNQSGFRKNRSTIDNIFYFKQKCLEAFNKKHKVCGVVFDIEKAFDKIWHEGLLYKMYEIKIPPKIGLWIENFLDKRRFFVYINDKVSTERNILTGVPQGSVLSPILFQIFINDIPIKVEKYDQHNSLLFADDLFSFYSDKNINRIQLIMQKYLDSLEEWFLKWRLKTAGNKCSYNIYQKTGKSKINLTLKIFGENIPREEHPKYLGIYLDSNLNFNYHIEYVRKLCIKKMNILKVLKYKKYELPIKTKVIIYYTLIRSVIEYGGPLWKYLSDYNKKRLQGIQYHALRHILKSPFMTSSTEMHNLLNVRTLDERFNDLNNRYIQSALSNNDLINNLLDEHLEYGEEDLITLFD